MRNLETRCLAVAAYDTIAFCESAGERGAQVVVPPVATAAVLRQSPPTSARSHDQEYQYDWTPPVGEDAWLPTPSVSMRDRQSV